MNSEFMKKIFFGKFKNFINVLIATPIVLAWLVIFFQAFFINLSWKFIILGMLAYYLVFALVFAFYGVIDIITYLATKKTLHGHKTHLHRSFLMAWYQTKLEKYKSLENLAGSKDYTPLVIAGYCVWNKISYKDYRNYMGRLETKEEKKVWKILKAVSD